MKSRMALSWFTVVFFLLISGTAMADVQWLDYNGYIPNTAVESITFETADILDPLSDITGSLVVSTLFEGGEIIKQLQLADDFLLAKIYLCFALENIPQVGPVTVKVYQGSPDPMAAVQTQVMFQENIDAASLLECNEVLVFDPLNPNPIVPSNGPLFLGIGFAFADSPVYLKAVGVEEFSDSFEIDGCDTGVMDRLVTLDGQINLLSAFIAECEVGPPKNHGQYVKCVSHTLNDLKKSGQITGREKGKIQRCAAKADIP